MKVVRKGQCSHVKFVPCGETFLMGERVLIRVEPHPSILLKESGGRVMAVDVEDGKVSLLEPDMYVIMVSGSFVEE